MISLRTNDDGFGITLIVIAIITLVLICSAGFFVASHRDNRTPMSASKAVSVPKPETLKAVSPPTLPEQTLRPLPSGSVWDEHHWYITDGSMTGVVEGSPSNVLVDQNGYLHLRITRIGTSYTAAELFSTDNIGFGTYQWQIQGSLSSLDPSTVVGLFLYGPQNNVGVDGENEIDIEFSQWNKTLCDGTCNADFTVYPSTNNVALGQTEDDFTDSRSGEKITTARVIWSSKSVTETVMNGSEPLGTTANVIHTWTFAPPDYQSSIPQQPLPIAMNLWSFRQPPNSNQEVIIRDFQYEPQ